MLVRRIALGLTTWFGSGYLRPGPGTWGTFFSMPLWIALQHYGTPTQFWVSWFILWIVMMAAYVKSVDSLSSKDASECVSDEVLGIGLTLGIAALVGPLGPRDWAICFILFRIFDIFKPYPIRILDRMSKTATTEFRQGFYVIADDLLAGVYAGALTFLIIYQWLMAKG